MVTANKVFTGNRVACDLGCAESVASCCRSLLKIVTTNGIWIGPTNTIYGIMGNGLIKAIADKIQKIKKRENSSFLMLVRDQKAAEQYASFPLSLPREIQEGFKKGYLTLVLQSKIPFWGESAALRLATDALHYRLLAEKEFPVLSTSANLSGESYLDDPGEIYSKLGGEADLFIDAGPLGNQEPSTLIDARKGKMKLLRKGCGFEKVKHVVA